MFMIIRGKAGFPHKRRNGIRRQFHCALGMPGPWEHRLEAIWPAAGDVAGSEAGISRSMGMRCFVSMSNIFYFHYSVEVYDFMVSMICHLVF